jgi:hypothetical protein
MAVHVCSISLSLSLSLSVLAVKFSFNKMLKYITFHCPFIKVAAPAIVPFSFLEKIVPRPSMLWLPNWECQKSCSNHLSVQLESVSKFLNSVYEFSVPDDFCRARQNQLKQGMLKGEVTLYHWPPVWLVWISLKNKNFQWIRNQSNRRSMVQRYFTLKNSLVEGTYTQAYT